MEEYSKMYLQELRLEDAEWINVAQYKDKSQSHVKTMTSLRDL